MLPGTAPARAPTEYSATDTSSLYARGLSPTGKGDRQAAPRHRAIEFTVPQTIDQTVPKHLDVHSRRGQQTRPTRPRRSAAAGRPTLFVGTFTDLQLWINLVERCSLS